MNINFYSNINMFAIEAESILEATTCDLVKGSGANPSLGTFWLRSGAVGRFSRVTLW